jgi:hypothetical protein
VKALAWRKNFAAEDINMRKPSFDAPIADEAPVSDHLTPYDEIHVIHYVILLDAEREQVPWDDVAREALLIDPAKERDRARRAYETHLARARWMANSGWRQLLQASDVRSNS